MSTLAHLGRRLLNMIAPIYSTASSDAGTIGTMQGKIGYQELRDATKIMQQFGFSSVPPNGTDGVVVFFGGDRSNGVIIATNHQPSRPSGRSAGETSVFNAFSMSIYLSENGVVLDGGGQPFHFINGDVHVDGEVIAKLGASQITLSGHKHTQNPDGHGDTEEETNPPVAGT